METNRGASGGHGDLPPGERGVTKVIRRTFGGPLPPPEVLQQYDQIVPGAAERIIAMAERQSAHRQDLEQQVIKSDVRNSWFGLVFGFILGIVGISGGVIVSVYGQATIGAVITLTSLGSLVGTFVYGSQQRRKEREAKQQDTER